MEQRFRAVWTILAASRASSMKTSFSLEEGRGQMPEKLSLPLLFDSWGTGSSCASAGRLPTLAWSSGMSRGLVSQWLSLALVWKRRSVHTGRTASTVPRL